MIKKILSWDDHRFLDKNIENSLVAMSSDELVTIMPAFIQTTVCINFAGFIFSLLAVLSLGLYYLNLPNIYGIMITVITIIGVATTLLGSIMQKKLNNIINRRKL